MSVDDRFVKCSLFGASAHTPTDITCHCLEDELYDEIITVDGRSKGFDTSASG